MYVPPYAFERTEAKTFEQNCSIVFCSPVLILNLEWWLTALLGFYYDFICASYYKFDVWWCDVSSAVKQSDLNKVNPECGFI